jgi:hypothetical protein
MRFLGGKREKNKCDQQNNGNKPGRFALHATPLRYTPNERKEARLGPVLRQSGGPLRGRALSPALPEGNGKNNGSVDGRRLKSQPIGATEFRV